MSKDTALVIIDVQVGLVATAYKGQEILDHIKALLAKARASGTPVIYVQHEESAEGGLVVGTPAWQIHPAIAPQEGEPVIHKRASDSFFETSLQQELAARGIKHIVVVGEQTDYCVDTSVRRATTVGYDVTLVGDAHTTEDNGVLTAEQIIAHHNATLDYFGTDSHRIRVKPTEEVTF